MTEIIIADAGLEDIDSLLSFKRADVQVLRVTATEDAHPLLAAALAERPSAVHIVAHGEPGRVRLGARPLDADSLSSRSWPHAEGTEIHIHACRAGADAAGRRLVNGLAARTGARVAASTRPVGHAARDGSWALDVSTGPIRNPSAFVGAESWPHLLAVTGTATAGNDTLVGDNSGNVISGLGGDDSLIGGTGRDTLQGGEGNDTLNGGPGGDVLDGGGGFDAVTYENATSGLTLNLLDPTKSTGEAAGDTFNSVERWIGSEQADTLIANDSGVWFWGHGGDDLEYGGAGNDTLESGNGNDTVYGGGGNDLMFGRIDNDRVYGQAGNDTIGGGAGDDLVDGGDGNDVLFSDWGKDTVQGGIGDDTIMAGEVSSGGYSEVQADIISGGDGNDTYIVANGLETGTVSFDGGTGTDTLRVSSDDVVDPEGKVGTATPQINISGMTLASVEVLGLTGSRHHTVTMTASQANGFTGGVTGASVGDVFKITGTAMSGTVGTGNGATLTAGQVQAEVVNGVTLLHIGTNATPGGDVTLRFAGSFTADQFQVSGTTVTLVQGGGSTGGGSTGGGSTGGGSTGGGSTGGGSTGTPGQTLTGTAARDVITGGTGNDTITGNAGNDYMEGGLGSDTFVLKPGDGWDCIGDFKAGAGGDVINLGGWTGLSDLTKVLATATEDSGGTVLNFSPTDSVRLMGVTKASLTADNFVFGGASSGDSTGGGSTGSGSTGGGSTGGGSTGGGSTGTPGQTFLGTANRDVIFGGAGNDTITGLGGNDYMEGGLGSDTFVLKPGDGWDCIGDFKAGAGGDVLDVRAIGGLTSLSAVLGHATQDSGGVSIDIGGSSSMRLMGVTLNGLTSGNFLFSNS
ncbi:DUF4347 domain-containing protein [Azospirillum canadense]|uniref:DUF4347 domain-containing protein n=1 Tax=Azospirillum canadense TaxID=403962 RepID=UPI0022275FDC|nr:DUF4347 domain-containing protein [Azospirillum canadense]MCW2243091.1 Ca2+-binding RTX toxin-like protein [Azospirillum canadense]